MSEDAEDSTPVLQIMPELRELREESSVVLSMELGSVESLAVAMTPSPPSSETSQPPVSVESGGLDASAILPIGHVVSLSNEVVDAGVLTPTSEALFGKELSNLLVSLEAVSPRYGIEIASVLTGTTSKDIIRKVEKFLRCKRKKRVIIWKAPQMPN
jgi:hypothetical protein